MVKNIFIMLYRTLYGVLEVVQLRHIVVDEDVNAMAAQHDVVDGHQEPRGLEKEQVSHIVSADGSETPSTRAWLRDVDAAVGLVGAERGVQHARRGARREFEQQCSRISLPQPSNGRQDGGPEIQGGRGERGHLLATIL